MKKETKKKEGTEPKEHKPNWKEYTASVEDIQNFLMDRILLRHNVITGRAEYRDPSLECRTESVEFATANDGSADSTAAANSKLYNLSSTLNWQPISDRVVNSLWAELSATKVVRPQDMYRVIESDFVPEYNPFTFYLEHLPPWDGDDYILGMSVSVTVKGEVEEQMLFAQYLKKWLVGMVAGWVDANVVNNVILVLIGEQGSYKTTWFNYLLPPELKQYFYTKTTPTGWGATNSWRWRSTAWCAVRSWTRCGRRS